MGSPYDIEHQYHHALETWGEDSLPPLSSIRVTVEPRMTDTCGRAFPKEFRRRNGQAVRRDYYAITLSEPIFAVVERLAGSEAFEDELNLTIYHELAHISQYYMGENGGHSYTFYLRMERLGYTLRNRFHAAPTDHVRGSREPVTWQQVLSEVATIKRRMSGV